MALDGGKLLIRLRPLVFASGVCMAMRHKLSQKLDINMLMTVTLNSALYWRSSVSTQMSTKTAKDLRSQMIRALIEGRRNADRLSAEISKE